MMGISLELCVREALACLRQAQIDCEVAQRVAAEDEEGAIKALLVALSSCERFLEVNSLEVWRGVSGHNDSRKLVVISHPDFRFQIDYQRGVYNFLIGYPSTPTGFCWTVGADDLRSLDDTLRAIAIPLAEKLDRQDRELKLGREAIDDLAGAITGADGERNLTPEEIGTIETSLAALKRSRLGPHESAFAALELKFADYKKVNSCV